MSPVYSVNDVSGLDRRRIDDGRRTTDDGRRTTDDGRRTTDDGRRTTDDGRRMRDEALLLDRSLVLRLSSYLKPRSMPAVSWSCICWTPSWTESRPSNILSTMGLT